MKKSPYEGALVKSAVPRLCQALDLFLHGSSYKPYSTDSLYCLLVQWTDHLRCAFHVKPQPVVRSFLHATLQLRVVTVISAVLWRVVAPQVMADHQSVFFHVKSVNIQVRCYAAA